MKKFIVSLAVVALVGTGAPAIAKKGGHGAHKAQKHRGYDDRSDWGERRFDRYRDVHRDENRYYDGRRHDSRFVGGRACPPGLAKKNNGCLPPGQARKLGVGDRLPEHLDRYNLPYGYRDRYRDDREHAYRYEDDRIYRVDRRSGIIEQIISAIGGGF